MSVGAERGSLPLALMVTILVTGLVSVVTASVVMGQQQTRFDESYERALQLAEAGADRALQSGGAESDLATEDGPDGDPREWALKQAHEATDDGGEAPTVRRLDGGGGWSYGIRVGQEDATDAIYGVGIVETADRTVERVVRYQMTDADQFDLDYAFLAGCSDGEELDIHGTGGGDDIVDLAGGNSADVHANCDIDLSGGQLTIQGEVSATGSIDGSGGISETASADEVSIPDVRARNFYDAHEDSSTRFDLCPDGMIRQPSESGTPCEGGEKADASGNASPQGWSWHETHQRWTLDGGEEDYVPGVYYAYQASVEVDNNKDAVPGTILVEAGDDDGQTGHLEMAGNSALTAYLSDVLFVVDGNIAFAGTSGAGSEVPPGAQGCSEIGGGYDGSIGLIAAGGFVDVTGNVSVCGAIVSAGDPDMDGKGPHGGGAGQLDGNARLFYDSELDVGLSSSVPSVRWSEL